MGPSGKDWRYHILNCSLPELAQYAAHADDIFCPTGHIAGVVNSPSICNIGAQCGYCVLNGPVRWRGLIEAEADPSASSTDQSGRMKGANVLTCLLKLNQERNIVCEYDDLPPLTLLGKPRCDLFPKYVVER
jgi:hypothetical protein